MTNAAVSWPAENVLESDRRAYFEQLVRQHQVALWRYLRTLGATGDEADDLAQEAFLVLWRRDDFEDRAVVATATFLRSTAKHRFLRRRRDRSRRELLLIELADQRWQQACDEDGGDRWLDALGGCLGELQPRARDAVLRWYGGERDEAAVALGLSTNGLKTLLQRARAALRTCIESRLGKPSGGRS
ncbi:MAG: RNA polymerase sigma factor [bacterium]|nr:RNA polymerase sigma factor [bacterium]